MIEVENAFEVGRFEVLLLVAGAVLTVAMIAFFAWVLTRADDRRVDGP